MFVFSIPVVMHKDKDDPGGLHRPRDLTAFDHTPLDGEMFLQVSSLICLIRSTFCKLQHGT